MPVLVQVTSDNKTPVPVGVGESQVSVSVPVTAPWTSARFGAVQYLCVYLSASACRYKWKKNDTHGLPSIIYVQLHRRLTRLGPDAGAGYHD